MSVSISPHERLMTKLESLLAGVPEVVVEDWLNNPERLSDRVREVFPFSPFKAWKVVITEAELSAHDFTATFKRDGIVLDPWGHRALQSVVDWGYQKKVALVETTPEGLGFQEESVEYSRIMDRAKAFGLQPCPLFVAPLLRVLDMPEEEDFLGRYFMSEPIDIGDGMSSVFWTRDIRGIGKDHEEKWMHRFDAVGADENKYQTAKLVFAQSW